MEEENKKITISKDKPQDLYQKLVDKFGINWNEGVIICYGDTIHCKENIPPEKFVHELVHVKQQEAIGKDLWWALYLDKPSFRLEQEIEAYRKEYKFICDNIKDRNARFEYLYEMARILSSSQYGSLVSFSDAQRLIKSNVV